MQVIVAGRGGDADLVGDPVLRSARLVQILRFEGLERAAALRAREWGELRPDQVAGPTWSRRIRGRLAPAVAGSRLTDARRMGRGSWRRMAAPWMSALKVGLANADPLADGQRGELAREAPRSERLRPRIRSRQRALRYTLGPPKLGSSNTATLPGSSPPGAPITDGDDD